MNFHDLMKARRSLLIVAASVGRHAVRKALVASSAFPFFKKLADNGRGKFG